VLQDNDAIAIIVAYGSDGDEFVSAAAIRFSIDGTPGDDDMPGEIEFLVTPDGSDTLASAGKIRSSKIMEMVSYYRTTTSLYRRYYHMPLAAFNPGATGATWTPPDANTVGGYKLDAATELLYLAADIHADWDGASDITVEVKYEINTASSENDTVDLKLVCYYKGVGDTTTKTQTLEVATNVGDGGANAQYTKFEMEFTINWDETDNVVEVGDDFHFILNLETDTSEVDNIIINGAALYYQTAHIGIESGDI